MVQKQILEVETNLEKNNLSCRNKLWGNWHQHLEQTPPTLWSCTGSGS